MAKILVVDDDELLRKFVCEVLGRAGVETRCADDGDRALEMASSEAFDLVLTDVAMPRMNGVELLAKLQALPSPPRALVMTADDTPETRLKAIREKAVHYISKPFDPFYLVQLVKEVLASPSGIPSIEVLSAQPNWVELLAPCDLATAERIQELMRNLKADLPEEVRRDIGEAFREMLMNAIEWGGRFDPHRMVRISFIRGRRMLLYRVSDPGPGFRPKELAHAAINNPPEDPIQHLEVRAEKGMRPGGFGLLMTRSMVDELIYNEAHNEVVLIKYLDGQAQSAGLNS